MAEFPHPLARNLWAGSMLSKDRSALSGAAGNTWVQTETGWEGTIGSSPTTTYSMIYTTTAHRVPVESNKPYSWIIPFRNNGTVPFPLSISTWLEHNTSGSDSRAEKFILSPGETRYVKLEGLTSPDAKDIRWSIYYGTGDPRPEIGAKVEILDGITLVQSATAPDFPFSGDSIYPMETVKRRNLAVDPLGPGMTGVGGIRSSDSTTLSVAQDEGRPVLEQLENGSSYGLYLDQWINFSPPVGTKIHARVDVKVTEDISAEMRLRVPSYSSASVVDPYGVPNQAQTVSQGWVTHDLNSTISAMPEGGYVRVLVYPNTGLSVAFSAGKGYRVRNFLIEYNTTGPYFDGDTPASGNLSYRWAPDGTSLEVETIQPPTGRTVVWDGEPYKSTSTVWVGDTAYATGVFEVSASTDARLGIVSDIYSRSREKIQLKLAGVDDLVRSGHRIELAAAAMTSTPAVWHWRQVTGPTVALNVRENTCDFIAPDVERSTRIRIGVYAASEDGGNRSDWHYFDLDVEPPMLRFRGEDDGDFSPRSPYLVGYSRGKREIWNDVIRPATYEKNPRHELEVLDLGIPDDDVVFSTTMPKRMAAGGVWVNPETGDVFRNFGAGYNETDDTTASPRTSTYWVNPANGDILEWIED